MILKLSFIAFTNSMTDNSSKKSLSHIPFLLTSLLELWCYEPNSVETSFNLASERYSLAFKFIRELAIILRNEIHEPSEIHQSKIVSWKFLFILNFWVRLLSLFISKSNHLNQFEMKEPLSSKSKQMKNAQLNTMDPICHLLYPLCQIIFEAIHLFNSPLYYPFKFQCIHLILKLSNETLQLIPVENVLLSMIYAVEDKYKPTCKSLPRVDFEKELKLSNVYLDTKLYQVSVIFPLISNFILILSYLKYFYFILGMYS